MLQHLLLAAVNSCISERAWRFAVEPFVSLLEAALDIMVLRTISRSTPASSRFYMT
jgi:hypothetical protein